MKKIGWCDPPTLVSLKMLEKRYFPFSLSMELLYASLKKIYFGICLFKRFITLRMLATCATDFL